MLRLIGLLLLIPLIDALLLVVATAYLGWQLVVLLVVLTALVGLLLVRVEGRHTLAKIQRKVARGEAPTDELIDGGLLIAAGAFLLTPGLVTDAVGFLLALPLSRVPIRMALKKYVVIPYLDSETGGFTTGNVYIGGFPGGDGDGAGSGFTMGGGAGFGGNEDGFDGDGFDEGEFGGNNDFDDRQTTGDSTGDDADRFDDPDHADGVVDVDFTVEDEESDRND